MKKLFALILAGFLLLSLTSCLSSDKKAKVGENGKSEIIRASVNGTEITADEINYFRNRLRADVINEFASEYNITDFSGFWDSEYGGQNPSDVLVRRAVSEAADSKQKLILMRDNGIYSDISFVGLKSLAEKYNAEHENAKGTVGINTIDLDTFYTYYISTGEMELKNVLAEGSLKPSEQEIAEAAKNNPDLTENGVKSLLVDEKYDSLLKEMFNSRKVEIYY